MTTYLVVLVDDAIGYRQITEFIESAGIEWYGISSSFDHSRPHELFFKNEVDAKNFSSNFEVIPLKDGHLFVPYLQFDPGINA